VKHLAVSQKCLQENEQFNYVIFADKCSVVLENHGKMSFHREWEHPLKVHVWSGISKPKQIANF